MDKAMVGNVKDSQIYVVSKYDKNVAVAAHDDLIIVMDADEKGVIYYFSTYTLEDSLHWHVGMACVATQNSLIWSGCEGRDDKIAWTEEVRRVSARIIDTLNRERVNMTEVNVASEDFVTVSKADGSVAIGFKGDCIVAISGDETELATGDPAILAVEHEELAPMCAQKIIGEMCCVAEDSIYFANQREVDWKTFNSLTDKEKYVASSLLERLKGKGK